MKISRLLPMGLCTSALLFAALAGCSNEATPVPTTEVDPGIVRTDVYEDILGTITGMPIEGDHSSELKIHHEHIPTFRLKSGEINLNNGVSGMNAMTMPFPPAEGLSLEGYEVGDKVRFTFAVNWGGRRAWEVTKIEKLSADAVVDYSTKPPAEGAVERSLPTADDVQDDHAGHDHSGHGHDGP